MNKPAARPLRLIAVAFVALSSASPRAARAGDYVLSFSNATQLVTSTAKVTTTNFTFEAWFKISSFTGENQICGQYSSVSGSNAGRTIVATRNTKASFFIGGTWIDGNATIPSNTWTHIAVTRVGSTGSIYVNGALDKTGTLPTNALPSVGITIGGINILNNGFRGQIADVRAWSIVRTASDITANMSGRLKGTESGLVGYWPVNNYPGTVVSDLVASANGTLSGTPLPAWSFSADLPLASSLTLGAWTSPNGGNWSDASKWLGGAVPNGDAHGASFTNQTPVALAVTNGLSPLRLGKVILADSAGITFSGNALTFTNASFQATLYATNGNYAFANPVAVGGCGLSADTRTTANLSFGDVLSGPGALVINPAASGGGTVTLSGANTYTGPTTLGSGAVIASTLADGGSASALGASSADPTNLVVGPGTLRYTGPSTSINRGLSLNPGSRKAAILCLDHDLTLSGPITNVTGAFIKSGPGTLTYAARGAALIGRQQSSVLGNQAAYPANGDSPANGFGCFTVAGGKVVLGAHPAQTNLFNEETMVGAYTTDQPGQEVTAELEIAGGYTRFNAFLDIGYYNGDTVTAPTPLEPKVTVSGGTLSASGLIVAFGYQTNQNAHATLNIAGGTMTVDGELRFGDQRGAPESPMLATLNLSSGVFRHTSTSAGFRMGWRSPAANATLNITGGLFDEYTDVMMAQNGNTSRLYLGGGTLCARNITHNSTNGISLLTFNGGTLQPRAAGYTLSGLTSAAVSTNGLAIDTSLASYTVAQKLSTDPSLGGATDGGLVKLGTNTLTWANTNSTFTGKTVVSNGTLRLLANLPVASALEVAPSGETLVGGGATQNLTFASVSLQGGGKLSFAFLVDGTSNDRATVSNAVDLAAGRIGLYQANTTLPFTKNGTYTLLSYSGAAPDVASLTCANAAYGKVYSFSSSAGTVRVTIASDTATTSLWKTNGGGNWSDAANWTVAPDAGAPARFDDAIGAPATVAVAGQTAGDLYFNNTNAYTLAGSGLALSSGASVTVESGTHTISAPLTLTGDNVVTLSPNAGIRFGAVEGASSRLTVQGAGSFALTDVPNVGALVFDGPSVGISNSLSISAPIILSSTTTLTQPTNVAVTLANTVSSAGGLSKAGAGSLTLSGANTYAGATTVSGGTLIVPTLANGGLASAVGSSSSVSGNLNLNGGTLRYAGPSNAVNRGFTLNPGSTKATILRLDNDLTVSGAINNTSGGFIKAGPGTLRYTCPSVTTTLGANQSGAMGTQGPYPANGDAPASGFGCFTIAQGKVVLGAPMQTNVFNAEVTIGAYTTSQAGQETTGELEFIDGFSNFKNLLDIGYYNGTTLTAPTPLQPTITVSGGAVTAVGMIIAFGYNYFGSAYPNTHAVLNIAGGTLTITGTDFRFGDQPGSGMLATINVYSGSLIQTNTTAGLGSYRGANNTLNLYGGIVDSAGDIRMGTNACTSRVNLNGGILRIRNINGGSGNEYLSFNGGTFQPRTSGQTLTDTLLSAVVSTNGAVVDTSLASYAIAQKLSHDPALGGAPDGGLLKLGPNSLSLTHGTNTFNGPVRVQAGLLGARLGGTNDLFVAPDAVFDALGQRATVGDLTGSGLLTNGVIAVTDRLDAGTNGAPAGARMTVQNLALTRGFTFACDWTKDPLGRITNDLVAVTEDLSVEGAGFVDFGRTEANAISVPFSTTIMSYGKSATGTFSGWKPLNTGLSEGKHTVLVVTADSGYVNIEVRYSGLFVLIK